jgi:hypothetical protein
MATFNFTFDPGTTVQQMLGLEMAGRIWSRYLTDNVTLNIQVGVSNSLGSNVIGGALPGMRASQNYAAYRTALNSGPKSADDNTAISNLPTTSYAANFSYNSSTAAFAVAGAQSTINMTRAVAKAAGMSLTDGSTALDGYILFSDLSSATANGQPVRWSYDYTRSNTQAANTLDFLSTAIHEIGHILGFVSGVDQPGWLNFNTTDTMTSMFNVQNQLKFANPLDLFRQSNTTRLTGSIDMSNGATGGEKFFSLDRGQTSLATFSSGLDTTAGGDGYQASHWKNGTTSIMNPTLSLSQRRSIASVDLRAMDVIGWDIASTGINTTIDLSRLLLQSGVALATRAAQGLNAVNWINNNLTAAPTQLVTNRDGLIYTMLQNSVVYDMTRIAAPSATGWTTRQTLAQVFQQRSFFSTVDELDSPSDRGSSLPLPAIAISGDLVSDRHFTNPTATTPQLGNVSGVIATITRILPFYRANFTTIDLPTPSSNGLQITIEVSAQPVQAQNTDILSGNYETAQFRAYDSRMQNQIAAANATEKTDNVFSLDQILHLDRAVF